MADDTNDTADLLYGMPSIAGFLNLRERQAYHLATKGDLPTFKLGGKVCARKSSLRAWLVESEAAAKKGDDAARRAVEGDSGDSGDE